MHWLVWVLQRELQVSKAIILCLHALEKKVLPWDEQQNSSKQHS